MAGIGMPSMASLQAAASGLTGDVMKKLSGILRKALAALSGSTASTNAGSDGPILRAQQRSWQDAVNGGIFPGIVNAYVTAAEQAHGDLVSIHGGPASDVPFLANSAAIAYLTDAANRMVDVSEGTWAQARARLIEGLTVGDSPQQLADRLREVTDWSEGRIAAVIRTEIVSASNAGALAQVQATGVVARKTWRAKLDDRTREAHRKADGQTVNVNNVFIVDGEALDFPGDPQGEPGNVINCRCEMAFTVRRSELNTSLAELPDTVEFNPSDFVSINSLVAASLRPETFVRRSFDENKVKRNRGRFAPKSGPSSTGADTPSTAPSAGGAELSDDERYEVYSQFTGGNSMKYMMPEILAQQAAAVAHNNDLTPEQVLEIVDSVGVSSGETTGGMGPRVQQYIADGGSFPDHSSAGDSRVPLALPVKTAKTEIEDYEEDQAAAATTPFPTGSEFPRLTLRQADQLQNTMFEQSGFWNPTERAALREYSSGGYLPVNNCLRFGEPCNDQIRETTQNIRESMRPLPQSLSTFRGVDLAALGITDPSQLEALVGSTLSDPGFTSTSVSAGGGFDKDVNMQIDVPAGTLGAYIRSVSSTSRENELLLDAGANFRIAEYRPSEGPNQPPYLRLEMVP